MSFDQAFPPQSPQPMQEMPQFSQGIQPATPEAAQMMAPPQAEQRPEMPPEPEPDAFEDGCKKDEEKKAALDKLNSLFTEYANYRRTYVEPMWNDAYAAYHGVPPADISPYGSYYPIKEIFRQVEALKPELHMQLFPLPEPFKYKPWRDGLDFDDQAEAATGIVHYQLRRFGINKQIQRWIDNTWVWGNSYLFVGWQRYNCPLRKIGRVSISEDGKLKGAWERQTEERFEEGPFARWIDHWCIYTDWREEDVANSPAVFVVDFVTAEYLKALVKEGKLDAKAVKEACEDGDNKGAGLNHATDTLRHREGSQGSTTNKEGLFELRWAWTNDGWKYATINGKFMACGQRNHLGRIPIFCLRNYPQPGEHYGKGEPAVLIWDQMLLNEAGSACMDAAHFTMNPMNVVARSEAKNWKLTSFKPGGTVFLDNPDLARPLTVNPVMPQWMEFVNFIRRNMQLTTGTTDEKQGITKHRTATGVKLLQDAASLRTNHKVVLNTPEMENLWAFLYDLNARFLDEEVALRIEGDDGRKIVSRYGSGDTFGPEVFVPSVDVKIELPPEMTAPEVMLQKWLSIYQATAADPLIDPNWPRLELIKAAGTAKPKKWLRNTKNEHLEAFRENDEWRASGLLPAVRNDEAHDVHIAAHSEALNTAIQQPGMPPQWLEMMNNHLQDHMAILQQIQGNAAGAAQVGGMNMSGSVLPEADAATEAQFSNGQRGAQEMGVM